MIITLNQMGTNRNVDNATSTTSYSTVTQTAKGDTSGYKLDIADNKVMDNEAYKSQGKTMEAVMQQAQLEDPTVQKNFMTVMSNSVSGEDLKRMQEEGYSAGDTDVDTYVDIVDRIKVTMAKAGVVIPGYNDDLPQDVVAEITGSVTEAKELSDAFARHNIKPTEENYEAASNAYQKANETEPLNDGTLQYMVSNQIDPTIENTYLAQFQAGGETKQAQGYFSDGTGYYARKAEDFNWDSLSSQIQKVCEQAGVDTTDANAMQEAMDNSKWLITQGIPLTADALQAVTSLKDMELPKDGAELADLIATAMENGKQPGDALLTGEESIYNQANEIVENVLSITPEAVDLTLAQGKDINLKNLTASQKQIIAKDSQDTDETVDDTEVINAEQTTENFDAVKAKRQLAEIQLLMTAESNVKLLHSGYQIDTKNLEQLVEDLKTVENSTNAILCKGDNAQDNVDKSSLFTESVEKVGNLPNMPAAVIGKVIAQGETFSIGTLHEEGTILQKTYQAAGETYEALMTAPRKDLGDNIQKAFQNVDDILEDMNLDTSSQNQRAVRILGYNSMEITEDNIQAVKTADQTVQNVMQKMTPAATLQMIRAGINPLTVSMDEMEEYLDNKDSSMEVQTKKYSEYLYQLEQNQQITDSEKDAYIGIYRLMRQVEKSDGAVIGSLVGQNAEINMKNLLSAVRTEKAKNINVSVDDDFGGLENVIQKGTSISDQIMSGFDEGMNQQQNDQQSEQQRQQASYYEKVSHSVFDQLSVDKVQQSGILEQEDFLDMNLEQVADQLNQVEEQNAYSEQYYASLQQECESLEQCNEAVVKTLIDYNQPVTMDHLLAQNSLLYQRGSLFQKIAGMGETDESSYEDGAIVDREDSFQEAVSNLTEKMTDKTSTQEAYQEMIQKASDLLEDSIAGQDVTSVDVKAANLLFKQLSLAANLAQEENYEIPVNIKGEQTSINLKVITNSNEKGKVSITMDTDSLGQVAAEFDVTSTKVQGFIACDSKAALTTLESMKEDMTKDLAQAEGQEVKLQVISTNTLDIQKFGEKPNKEVTQEDTVTTKALYRVSMSFVKALQEL